jgi:hypothetical protein
MTSVASHAAAGRGPLVLRAVLGELVVCVYDRGPEPCWHSDGGVFGGWLRYRAEGGGLSALGSSPRRAIYRLIATYRQTAPGAQPGVGPA